MRTAVPLRRARVSPSPPWAWLDVAWLAQEVSFFYLDKFVLLAAANRCVPLGASALGWSGVPSPWQSPVCPAVAGGSGRHCRQDSERPRVRRVPCALCAAPAALALRATECARAGACHRARPSRRAASDSRRLMLFKYKLDDTAGDDIKRLKKQHKSAAAYNGMACAGRSWRYGRVLAQMWASPGADVGMFETEQLSHARASFCHDAPHVHCTTWSGTRGQNNVGCARSHAIPCDTVWYAAWHGLVTYRHVARRIPMRTTALRVARCTLRVARCRFKLVSSAEMRAKEVRTGSACSTYAHYPSRAHRATAHCAYPPGPTAFPHCIALAPIARDAAAAYGSAVRVCCIMVVAPTAAMQRVRRRAAHTVRRGGRCSTRRR